MEFDHGVAGFDGVVGVDLDFVVFLGGRERRNNGEGRENTENAEKSAEGNGCTSLARFKLKGEGLERKLEWSFCGSREWLSPRVAAGAG